MKIAVSYIKSKYSSLETIKRINNTSADYLHLDLMDGIYVNNKNFNKYILLETLKIIRKPMQVHFMTIKPYKYLKYLKHYNIETIYFHLDALSKPLRTINEISKMNINPGIVINPNDDITLIDDYFPLIKDILIMSVNPGMGGQTFMMETLDKIKKIDQIRRINKYEFRINVDGGINQDIIDSLKELDVDIIVSGSYICESDNYEEKIKSLR